MVFGMALLVEKEEGTSLVLHENFTGSPPRLVGGRFTKNELNGQSVNSCSEIVWLGGGDGQGSQLRMGVVDLLKPQWSPSIILNWIGFERYDGYSLIPQKLGRV